MKCGVCKKYMSTATKGYGVCSAPTAYFPVEAEDICHFIPPKPTVCRDCGRFGEDTACMDVSENDPIYIDGERCSGFIDSQVEALEQEVFNFFMSHDGDKEVTKTTVLGMIEKMQLPWE